MSRINEKLGLKAAGARARLNALSGVPCPKCRGVHVISNVVHGRLLWLCGFCSESWEPTPAEIQRYNGRVRDRDRIIVRGSAEERLNQFGRKELGLEPDAILPPTEEEPS